MKFTKGNHTFLIFAAIAIALLLSFADEWTNKFREDYRIYSLPIPDKTIFAEEEIALTDEDLRERYDRELLTNTYWQSQTLLILKRGQKIFPVIEPILKRYNIPDDFKYLAVTESGLQPLVVSPAGAASYWQFLDKTGKVFGLTINEEVDERYHLEKSTEAACKYFRQAYNAFGSWKLVAASYNMGIEGVKRQINQQRIGNYEDLYLNQETARYLFRIIAIKTIFENPKAFGFHLAPAHSYQRESMTIITVNKSIDNLVSFASQYGCTYKDLKYYNPWLRKPTLTVNAGQIFYIALPRNKVRKVINNARDTIIAIPLVESDLVEYEHTIEEGESLQTIAEKYNVPVSELRKWNNLTTDRIKPGSILKIKKQLME